MSSRISSSSSSSERRDARRTMLLSDKHPSISVQLGNSPHRPPTPMKIYAWCAKNDKTDAFSDPAPFHSFIRALHLVNKNFLNFYKVKSKFELDKSSSSTFEIKGLDL